MAAEIWLEKAKNTRLMVQAALELHSGDWGCFLSHQMAELALKSVLVLHRGSCPQTHSIEQLLAECVRYNPDFARLNDNAEFISRMYLSARYANAPGVSSNTPQHYSEADAIAALSYADEVLALAQAQFPADRLDSEI